MIITFLSSSCQPLQPGSSRRSVRIIGSKTQVEKGRVLVERLLHGNDINTPLANEQLSLSLTLKPVTRLVGIAANQQVIEYVITHRNIPQCTLSTLTSQCRQCYELTNHHPCDQ